MVLRGVWVVRGGWIKTGVALLCVLEVTWGRYGSGVWLLSFCLFLTSDPPVRLVSANLCRILAGVKLRREGDEETGKDMWFVCV